MPQTDPLPDYGYTLAGRGYRNAHVCLWLALSEVQDHTDHRMAHGITVDGDEIFEVWVVTTQTVSEIAMLVPADRVLWAEAKLCGQPCCCLCGWLYADLDVREFAGGSRLH